MLCILIAFSLKGWFLIPTHKCCYPVNGQSSSNYWELKQPYQCLFPYCFINLCHLSIKKVHLASCPTTLTTLESIPRLPTWTPLWCSHRPQRRRRGGKRARRAGTASGSHRSSAGAAAAGGTAGRARWPRTRRRQPPLPGRLGWMTTKWSEADVLSRSLSIIKGPSWNWAQSSGERASTCELGLDLLWSLISLPDAALGALADGFSILTFLLDGGEPSQFMEIEPKLLATR